MKRIKLFEEYNSELPSILSEDLAMDLSDYLSDKLDSDTEYSFDEEFSISKVVIDGESDFDNVSKLTNSYLKKNLHNYNDYGTVVYSMNSHFGGVRSVKMIVLVFKIYWLDNIIKDCKMIDADEEMYGEVHVSKDDNQFIYSIDENDEQVNISFHNITKQISKDSGENDSDINFISHYDVGYMFESILCHYDDYIDSYRTEAMYQREPKIDGVKYRGFDVRKYL